MIYLALHIFYVMTRDSSSVLSLLFLFFLFFFFVTYSVSIHFHAFLVFLVLESLLVICELSRDLFTFFVKFGVFILSHLNLSLILTVVSALLMMGFDVLGSFGF